MMQHLPLRLLLSLSLLLVHQTTLTCTQAAGLRGNGGGESDDSDIEPREQWRTALIESSTGSASGVHPLLRPSTPTELHLSVNEEDPLKDALICPYHAMDNSDSDSHCPSSHNNRTTPVCQYNPETRDYETICLKTQSIVTHHQEPSAILLKPHRKSHCGTCKKCFDDRAELQVAIDHYKSYTQVNTDLADTYGWPIGNWCVDRVTSFSNLFFRQSKFNEDLSHWETSQVTDMTSMFQNAFAFNQPLATWDTSRVTEMTRMFAMAIHFDQDISSWDTSNVHDFGYMFLHALEFNQDLSGWQVHNALHLNSMFFGATNFEKHHLTEWQISEHADTENMCQWEGDGEKKDKDGKEQSL